MILIIEGLDGVGKTTLSKIFAEKYNFEYIHESYIDDPVAKESRYYNFLKRLNSDKNYIYDRITIIDDFVYEFLNIEKSSLHLFEKGIIKALNEVCVIHLELDEEVRKSRFEKRGDEYVTNDMMSLIKTNYEKFYKKISKSVSYLKLTGDKEQDIEQMMKILRKRGFYDRNITHSV